LALYWSFSSSVGVKFAQSSSHGKQGLIHEEMSQTLLTNKKQVNVVKVHAANITVLSQRKLALTARNTLFALKSLEYRVP
jgi:hypothetical protein